MSSIGTFGSFTQARLGIYVSQSGLSVTGNNIANINTKGYTRQKLNQTSFYAGGSDRYYSTYDLRIGNGALARSVNQLRDPYLDIRYRNEMSGVGAMDTKLAGLQDIQRILDEVGDGDEAFGILEAQFSEFVHQLQMLNDQTGQDSYDIQVRAAAEAIVNQFNTYASQLEQSYSNLVTDYEQSVKQVNTILTDIRELNVNIRKAEIHGDNALELRDERNLLIDELSSFMKIDVKYTEEDIGGIKIEKLTIKLGDANPDPTAPNDTATLVDGIYCTQLALSPRNQNQQSDMFLMDLGPLMDSKDRVMNTITKGNQQLITQLPTGVDPNGGSVETQNADGTVTISTYTKLGMVDDGTGNMVQQYLVQEYLKTPSTTVELADNDLYGSLQAQRELLTEEGEFASQDMINMDPNAATKRGIPFYQKALDLLANRFANVLNEANQGYLYNKDGNYVDSNGNELVINGQPISKNGLTADQTNYLVNGNGPWIVNGAVDLDAYMQAAQGVSLGGPLFSNNGDNDDPTGITASNISISLAWSKGPLLVNSFEQYGNLGVASTDGSNILHMIALMDTKMDYNPQGVDQDAVSNNMFNGTFAEMWTNIGSLLGNDMMTTQTKLDTYYAASVELDTGRDSVSAVDLNDEAMNLMQYSKSYNAACRLMTTIDSVLDKLINGTGVLT